MGLRCIEVEDTEKGANEGNSGESGDVSNAYEHELGEHT